MSRAAGVGGVDTAGAKLCRHPRLWLSPSSLLRELGKGRVLAERVGEEEEEVVSEKAQQIQ